MLFLQRFFIILLFIFFPGFVRAGEKIEHLKKCVGDCIVSVRAGEKPKSHLNEECIVDDEYQRLPLSIAVRYKLTKEMEDLLHNGADPLQEGSNGGPLGEVYDKQTIETLLSYTDSSEKFVIAFADFFNAFENFNAKERIPTLKWFLDQDIDPNELMPRYGIPKKVTKSAYFLPLIWLTILATQKNLEVESEIKLLLAYGANPYEFNSATKLSAYLVAQEEEAYKLVNLLEKEYEEYKNNCRKLKATFYDNNVIWSHLPSEKKYEVENAYWNDLIASSIGTQ